MKTFDELFEQAIGLADGAWCDMRPAENATVTAQLATTSAILALAVAIREAGIARLNLGPVAKLEEELITPLLENPVENQHEICVHCGQEIRFWNGVWTHLGGNLILRHEAVPKG